MLQESVDDPANEADADHGAHDTKADGDHNPQAGVNGGGNRLDEISGDQKSIDNRFFRHRRTSFF